MPQRAGRLRAYAFSSLAEDEGEQRRERQVDEVRRLDQTDGQEELTGELALGLGLPRDAADEGVTGDAVTDARTDRTAAERQPTADETAGGGDCLRHVLCCHFSSLPFEDVVRRGRSVLFGGCESEVQDGQEGVDERLDRSDEARVEDAPDEVGEPVEREQVGRKKRD